MLQRFLALGLAVWMGVGIHLPRAAWASEGDVLSPGNLSCNQLCLPDSVCNRYRGEGDLSQAGVSIFLGATPGAGGTATLPEVVRVASRGNECQINGGEGFLKPADLTCDAVAGQALVCMKVVGYDPVIKSASQVPGKLAKMSEDFTLVTTPDEAISLANIVTVHVPKNKDTANLINAERIGKLKKPAFVINCSRGGIVDETAVIKALDAGQLQGAAFDVFEKEPPVFPTPLASHPKIAAAPHLGASTFEAQERVALTAAAQMVGFFKENSRAGIIN